MTQWKYTMYSPALTFAENVILNNHVSDEPKDYIESVITKAKRELGIKGKSKRKEFSYAASHLEDDWNYLARWTTPTKFNHFSVITEQGLAFKEDNKGLHIWCSNKWNGLPAGYNDVLTFMLLSSWRYDRHLRTQRLEVQTDLGALARRFGDTWSEKEIDQRIKRLQKLGCLNGNMLSELTFSKDLEERYRYDELR